MHPFMEHDRSIKDILLEEINTLNHEIEEARKTAKDCSQYRKKLAERIVELSQLPPDKN